jgi:uncharacterized protein with GYD domain
MSGNVFIGCLVSFFGEVILKKYLIQGSYTVQGMQGLIKEGSSSRIKHFRENISNLGGKVESVHHAFGEYDVYAIVELEDNISSAALTMALSAGGGFKASTIVLLTPEEMDKAIKRTSKVGYHPPGTRTE